MSAEARQPVRERRRTRAAALGLDAMALVIAGAAFGRPPDRRMAKDRISHTKLMRR